MKRRLLQKECGASTVEFALTAIVLLMCVFGIIEFGILMFDKQELTNAVREGARAGIVRRTPRVSDFEIRAVVKEWAEEHLVSFRPSITLDDDDITIFPPEPRAGNPFGTEMVVTANYPFHFLVLSGVGVGPITLTAETRMKME